LNLRQFINAYSGYIERKESDLQRELESQRYQAALIISHNGFMKKAIKPTDLGKFDWELTDEDKRDRETERKPYTRQEIERIASGKVS
jgi:hypothetical protein